MNKKRLLVLLISLAIIITSIATVSAGLFDSNNSNDKNIKTHEFNYGNMATFNISDDLTNKTGVEKIVFGQGVSYKYPDKNDNGLVNMLGGLAHYDGGSDPVESNQNTAYYKEIKGEPTSQGYKSYIFKMDNSEQYQVYIDLNNVTIVGGDGFESQYDYFTGTFQSLEEAKIFIETFKINENAIKK